MADKNQVFDNMLQLPIQAVVSKGAINSDALPNSIMNRQQADRFIDMLVDTSTVLKQIRVRKVSAPKGSVNRLDMGVIATEGASTTSSNTLSGPQESVIEYDTEKYRSAFDLPTDFLEDNIERDAARDTIMGMFAKRMAIDSELAAIESDDDLPTGDGQTRENNLLGVNNGWRKILYLNTPQNQIIDAAGAGPSKALYWSMKRKIPARYRVAKPNYVWLVPSGVYDRWVLEWTGRVTPNGPGSTGGDGVLASGFAPGPFGIPMLEVPLWPETYGSVTANGTGGDTGISTLGAGTKTEIILTPLENLIFFMQRDITIEWDRRPRKDAWEVTIHWRGDFQIETPELVIMAKNVVSDAAAYSNGL
jgi:hypothetical protein